MAKQVRHKATTDIVSIRIRSNYNSDDKERLRAIMNSNSRYEEVDEETVDIITTYTNLKISKKGMVDGKMSMCKGMQDLIDEEKAKEKKRADAAEKRADDAERRVNAAEARVKELEASIRALRAELSNELAEEAEAKLTEVF